MISLAPTPFEVFASDKQYDTAPAVSPSETRQYADRRTQEAFNAYKAGQQNVARMITESSLETEALREKLLELAK